MQTGLGSSFASSRRRQLVLAAVLSVFAVVLVRTAWMSDDAYITLRTVDNFIHGHGLRWNGDERVQTYTHPLWMLVLSAVSAMTRELYFTSLAVGAACSITAMWLCLARVSASPAQAFLGSLILVSSKAFVDYSTSGLENPLTHLLLVLLWIASSNERSRARGLPLLVASFLLITRQDLLWLLLPLLVVLGTQSPRPSWRSVLIALLPLVAWEAFSMFYYGFPVPNTAYAKLKTGIPEFELIQQGGRYLVNSFTRDPLTLATITVAAAVSLASKAWSIRAIGIGLVAHVIYMLSVGGDFMSGRFFTVALMFAVLFLVSRPVALRGYAVAAAAVTVVALGFIPAVPTLTSGRSFAARNPPPIVNGIADERSVYFQTTGLLRMEGSFLGGESILTPTRSQGALARVMVQLGQRVATREQVGFFGFAAGPDLHVVDWLGLGDPLMARLPSRRPWSIGHFPRDLPPGYIETLRTGEPRIQDPGLRAYFAELVLITRGPLLSWARLRAIVRMNLGLDERLLAPYWNEHAR